MSGTITPATLDKWATNLTGLARTLDDFALELRTLGEQIDLLKRVIPWEDGGLETGTAVPGGLLPSEPETETGAEPETETEKEDTATREEAVSLALSLLREGNTAAVKKALKNVGAAKVSEVWQEDLPTFLETLRAAAQDKRGKKEGRK